MPYSKVQLLAIANEKAVQSALPPISESVFESWVQKGLFEGAQAQGVKRGVHANWSYIDEAKETVELIIEFKSQGAARTSQLLVCLWAFGRKFPGQKVTAAVKSELRRIVKRQERGSPWWAVHPDDISRLSESERSKRISQLPPLDPDLAKTPFALSPDRSLVILSRAYWGAETGSRNLFQDFYEKLGLFASEQNPLAMLFSIAGAIGLPEDSATGGYQTLDQISEDDLKSAREWFCLCFAGLAFPERFFSAFPSLANTKAAVAYRKAANSFLRPDWVVPTIALFAIAAFNCRRLNPGRVAK